MEARQQLEADLGYSFQDRRLLDRALTHSSHVGENGRGQHNERLEFLGDAVLELTVSEILMERFPDYPEGRLTKLRAQLVNADNLQREARSLGIGEYLLLGKAELNSGGRSKKALLADALEAIVAAVYLDSGLPAARQLVERTVAAADKITAADATLAEQNPKSTLQELLQAHKIPTPTYEVVQEIGPPHDRVFEVRLTIDGLCEAAGRGPAKRDAEQAAAANALSDPAVSALGDN